MWTPGTRPDIIVWDLDGTLVDSSPGIYGTIDKTLDALGITVPADIDKSQFIGPPLRVGFQLIGVDPAQAATAADTYRDLYGHEGVTQFTVHDAALDALRHSATAGTRSYVATAKTQHYAAQIVAQSSLREHLTGGADAVIGHIPGDPHRETKTDILGHALSHFGLTGHPNIVMIGDRHHDAHGATAHGLPTIGVLWGFGDRTELTDAGCATITSTGAELNAVLGV